MNESNKLMHLIFKAQYKPTIEEWKEIHHIDAGNAKIVTIRKIETNIDNIEIAGEKPKDLREKGVRFGKRSFYDIAGYFFT